jgi:hypothetical protein
LEAPTTATERGSKSGLRSRVKIGGAAACER